MVRIRFPPAASQVRIAPPFRRQSSFWKSTSFPPQSNQNSTVLRYRCVSKVRHRAHPAVGAARSASGTQSTAPSVRQRAGEELTVRISFPPPASRTTLQNNSEVHRFGDSANQILPDPHGYRYLRSMPTSVQKPIYINGSC